MVLQTDPLTNGQTWRGVDGPADGRTTGRMIGPARGQVDDPADGWSTEGPMDEEPMTDGYIEGDD